MAKPSSKSEGGNQVAVSQGPEQQGPESKAAEAWRGFMSHVRRFSAEELITIKVMDEIVQRRLSPGDISEANLAAVNAYLNEGATPASIADERQMLKHRVKRAHQFFVGKTYSPSQMAIGNDAFFEIASDDEHVNAAFKGLKSATKPAVVQAPRLFDVNA